MKRKHHFIPATYLAGFTDKWERVGRFWAVPKNNTSAYGTNANDACAIRDYNRLDVGEDPNLIEDWYGDTVESDIGESLNNIRGSGNLPENKELTPLLILLAILFSRNPTFRSNTAMAYESMCRAYLSMLESSQDLYESTQKEALEEGYIDHLLPFEEFLELTEKEKVSVIANKDYLIISEVEGLKDAAEMLSKRRWRLYSIEADSDFELITSDRPFILSHPDATPKMPLGLETSKSTVMVPINKRSLLIGSFEDGDNGSYIASRELIGNANTKIVQSCDKLFYSSKESISFSDSNKNWNWNIFQNPSNE